MLELAGQQVLKLVGLDAEDVGLMAAEPLDAAGHDLGRRPPGQVGLDVEHPLPIDAQHDQRRIVAAARVAPLARIEGHRLHREVGRPGVEPDRFVEVGLGPFAEVGIDRRVLLLSLERGAAPLGPHAHQRVEVLDRGPEQDRAAVHRLAALVVKLAGDGYGGMMNDE